MNRINLVKKEFPNIADQAIQLSKPSHNNKYLMWIAQQLSQNHHPSDIAATIDAFTSRPKAFKHTDLYCYNDLKELENEVKKLNTSKRQSNIAIKKQSVKTIHDNEYTSVIRVDSKEAMIIYGKGTSWCITMPIHNYWEVYSKDGAIFYLLFDKQKNKKFCINKTNFSLEVFDSSDTQLDIREFARDPHITKALLSTLFDTEDSMWNKMRYYEVSKQEVDEWLSYQSSTTKSRVKKAYPAIFFTYKNDTHLLNLLNKLKPDVLERFVADNKNIVKDKAIKTLSKSHKGKYFNLRKKLGKLFPDQENKLLTKIPCFEQLQEIKKNKSKLRLTVVQQIGLTLIMESNCWVSTRRFASIHYATPINTLRKIGINIESKKKRMSNRHSYGSYICYYRVTYRVTNNITKTQLKKLFPGLIK